MLLLALIVALILRFYRLGEIPLGLYRDEAINGLDALKVLQGEHAIFFPANNGREPLYIYLTAAAVALFGQTIFALRFAAAIVGSLTTLPVYLLAKSWFGWRVGLLSAWIWAITLWPVHLSRVGLRVILLAPLLTLAFWLGTLAYRRRQNHLWFLSGLLYALSFYSYLAARFTPLILVLVALFLLLKGEKRRLWPGALWFLLGSFLTFLPLIFLFSRQPDLILGRSGQVSLFHPDVNHGDLFGTFWRQIAATLGMFIWRGDTILRHNPAGRPVFDFLLALPFLLGLIWSIKNWRRPPAFMLLVWTACMLGPTIFAADAPHFLRAAGALPAIIFLPALGLDQIWLWTRISRQARAILIVGLLLGSLIMTVRDYSAYSRDPQVANAFESVASSLAQQLNQEAPETNLFLDSSLWRNWPSLPYLVVEPGNVTLFSSVAELPRPVAVPAIIYAWPYEPLQKMPEHLPSSSLLSITSSDLVYGELDDSAYNLFLRYQLDDLPSSANEPIADFAGELTLLRADLLELADDRLQVDVYWQLEMALDEELVAFVHVLGPAGLIGQHDAPPAEGRWPVSWWQTGQVIRDRHSVNLDQPYDEGQQQIQIGLYKAATGERLAVYDFATGEPLGTTWTIGSK